MIGFMLISLKVVNIAVEFFACSKRFAIVLRKRVIGTRFSVRSPIGTAGASVVVLAALAAGTDFNDFSTSSLVTRPPLPVPLMLAASRPFSANKRRTDGLSASDSAPLSAAAAATGAATATAPATNLAIACSAKTVAPSSKRISDRTPALGATTSSTTLSVSISTRFWSCSTASPTFTCHVAIVASATDSGNTGTLISVAGPLAAGAATAGVAFAAGTAAAPPEVRLAINCSPNTVSPS